MWVYTGHVLGGWLVGRFPCLGCVLTLRDWVRVIYDAKDGKNLEKPGEQPTRIIISMEWGVPRCDRRFQKRCSDYSPCALIRVEHAPRRVHMASQLREAALSNHISLMGVVLEKCKMGNLQPQAPKNSEAGEALPMVQVTRRSYCHIAKSIYLR